jgi:hypothetical protein
MTDTPDAQRWAGPMVGLLTVGWVVAAAVSAWRLLGLGLMGWASPPDDQAQEIALHHQAAVAALVLVAVAAGGPALIAMVAHAGGMDRAGMVYLGMAVVLGVLALPVAASAYRTLGPAPEPPDGPAACQEHSGSDNRCPGN